MAAPVASNDSAALETNISDCENQNNVNMGIPEILSQNPRSPCSADGVIHEGSSDKMDTSISDMPAAGDQLDKVQYQNKSGGTLQQNEVTYTAASQTEVSDNTVNQATPTDNAVSLTQVLNSTVNQATAIDDAISQTQVLDTTVNQSTVNDDTVSQTQVLNSIINQPTATDNAVSLIQILDSTVNQATATDGAVNLTQVLDSTVNQTTVIDDTVSQTEVLNSSVNQTTVIDDAVSQTQALDSIVKQATVIDDAVRESQALNSIVKQTTVIDDAVSQTQALDSTVKQTTVIDDAVSQTQALDSTVKQTTVIDDAVSQTQALDSIVKQATVIDDAVRESQALNSIVKQTTVIDDAVSQTQALDSTVKQTTAIDDAVSQTQVLDSTFMQTTVIDDAVSQTQVMDNAVSQDSVMDNAVSDTQVMESVVNQAPVIEGTVSQIQVMNIAVSQVPVRDGSDCQYQFVDDTVSQLQIKGDTANQSKVLDNFISQPQDIANVSQPQDVANISQPQDSNAVSHTQAADSNNAVSHTQVTDSTLSQPQDSSDAVIHVQDMDSTVSQSQDSNDAVSHTQVTDSTPSQPQDNDAVSHRQVVDSTVSQPKCQVDEDIPTLGICNNQQEVVYGESLAPVSASEECPVEETKSLSSDKNDLIKQDLNEVPDSAAISEAAGDAVGTQSDKETELASESSFNDGEAENKKITVQEKSELRSHISCDDDVFEDACKNQGARTSESGSTQEKLDHSSSWPGSAKSVYRSMSEQGGQGASEERPIREMLVRRNRSESTEPTSDKPVLETLSFSGIKIDEAIKESKAESDTDVCVCLLCDRSYPADNKDVLAHLVLMHKFVIADVNFIANLPAYLRYWKVRFQEKPVPEFCSKIVTNTGAKDHAPKEEFYLLCDALPEDKSIREHLQRKKLESVLAQQQKEREETKFCRQCLFCKQTFCGNRAVLFDHLLRDHTFHMGQPDNLVYTDELFDLIQSKLDNQLCLFCEKSFKDKASLREHMRKKQHRKINPKNKEYDRFYIVNYMEMGKNWESLQSEDNRLIRTSERDSDEEEEWSGWNEESESRVVCLFCDSSFVVQTDLQQHMKNQHSFDLQEVNNKLQLNFYQKVKLINYIRRLVYHKTCYGCQQVFDDKEKLVSHFDEFSDHLKKIPESEVWDQPQYFFPTYEDDCLLCHLDDDDEGAAGDALGVTVIAEAIPVADTILTDHKLFRDLLK